MKVKGRRDGSGQIDAANLGSDWLYALLDAQSGTHSSLALTAPRHIAIK